MNFRLAQTDDWDKFRTLRLIGMETDPQAFGGDLTEEKERKEPEWRKRIESTDRFFFIAEDVDVFVSMAGAKKISEQTWMLAGVFTVTAFRGRGIARKLTELVLIEAKHKGAHLIQLMVNVDQKDAVKIYTNLGFKITKTLKGELMADGKLHDEYVMEKHLV